MKSLLRILEESGKFDVKVNKYGTISATLSIKQGATVVEAQKVIHANLANSTKITLDKGVLDVTPALLEDTEVKKAVKEQGAKTIQLFIGPRFLIIVGRDENGKWIDNDQAVSWDKIQGPVPKKEEGKGQVEVQGKKK